MMPWCLRNHYTVQAVCTLTTSAILCLLDDCVRSEPIYCDILTYCFTDFAPHYATGLNLSRLLVYSSTKLSGWEYVCAHVICSLFVLFFCE